MNLLSRPDDTICNKYTQLLSKDLIKTSNDKIMKKLNVTVSYAPLSEVNEEILKSTGRIFAYLNFCLPQRVKIIQYFKELLLEGSVKEILLGTSNVLKTKRNAEKEIAIVIWNKLEKDFNLKHNSIAILASMKQESENFTHENLTINGKLAFLGLKTFSFKSSNF